MSCQEEVCSVTTIESFLGRIDYMSRTQSPMDEALLDRTQSLWFPVVLEGA